MAMLQPTHSKLGFSSRARWRACPASVAMSAGIPGSTSPAAEEGTCAHAVKEHYMRRAFNLPGAQQSEAPDQLVPAGLDLKGETPAAWNETLRKHGKAYVQAIYSIIGQFGGEMPVVVEEQRVAATSLHPDLYGTADTLLWFPIARALAVVDYKYGYKDVDVGTVEDANPQLAAYGVSAAEQLGTEVRTLMLVVVQPRVPLRAPVRELRINDAPAWLAKERAAMQAEALATEQPSAPVPGDYCRYCKAARSCPATVAVITTGLQWAAGRVDLLDIPEDELLALYSARSAFKGFMEDLEERIEGMAKAGHARLTVSESKGRQMWADPKNATLTLLALGRTDLLQPVALSDALPAMPTELHDELVKRSAPSRTIKVVSAPVVKEVAKMFEKYAKTT